MTTPPPPGKAKKKKATAVKQPQPQAQAKQLDVPALMECAEQWERLARCLEDASQHVSGEDARDSDYVRFTATAARQLPKAIEAGYRPGMPGTKMEIDVPQPATDMRWSLAFDALLAHVWMMRPDKLPNPIERWTEHGGEFVDGHRQLGGAAALCKLLADDIRRQMQCGPPAGDDEAPALTKSMEHVLLALHYWGPRLASVADLKSESVMRKKYAEHSIRDAINKLIASELAERPEGSHSGARLTPKGRQLAEKFDKNYC